MSLNSIETDDKSVPLGRISTLSIIETRSSTSFFNLHCSLLFSIDLKSPGIQMFTHYQLDSNKTNNVFRFELRHRNVEFSFKMHKEKQRFSLSDLKSFKEYEFELG